MAHLTPGTHGLSLDHDGHPRCYRVHVPPEHRRDKPSGSPIVMLLPGAGATSRWTLAETRLAAAADRHGFLAVIPEALPLDPAAPPSFLANPQVWNAGRGPRLLVTLKNDDVGFLRAVLDDLPRHMAVDSRRIYVTGFSNGAAMTFRAGAELADRIAAIAPVAGPCLVTAPHLSRPVPTLYIIGDSDPLVPLHGGDVRSPWTGKVEPRPPVRETLERWADAIGAKLRPSVVRDTDSVRVEEHSPKPGGAELVVVTVTGLGHHWPGGRGQLKHSLAGPRSDKVSANDVIWEFFQKHLLTD